MKQRLLIAGIDPGTTKAYALFTLDKELVACASGKDWSLPDFIRELSSFGNIVAIGTDKKKVPEFVGRCAIKLGARVFAPEHDIEIALKLETTRDFDTKNAHEKDALASALWAYKSISGTIEKVTRFTSLYKKENLREAILELVLLHQVSIKLAVDILEKPEVEYSKESKKILEQPKLTREDFARLLSKLHEKERDIALLKRQVRSLEREAKQVISVPHTVKPQELVLSKRVTLLYRSLDAHKQQLSASAAKITRLNSLISKLGRNYVLVKKLETLGLHEFSSKAALLSIRLGDILLVANPSVYSESVLAQLKDVIILYKKKPADAISQRFVCIPVESIEMHEDVYFAACNRDQLRAQVADIERLKKIVEAYKDERARLKV